MAKVSTLPRKFLVGALKIDDPSPTSSLASVTKILGQQYPQFRWTTVHEEDGRVVGEELHFSLVLPEPKVNG